MFTPLDYHTFYTVWLRQEKTLGAVALANLNVRNFAKYID